MKMSEVVNYRDVSDCPFAQKAWVSPRDEGKEIPYEKGTFARAYCRRLDGWCTGVYGHENCMINEKAGE